MMAYYDRIARKWHSLTGAQGGAFKKLVLNEVVLGKLPSVAGLSILELGAGNGYFLPLVLQRFSGQVPTRVVITDQSQVLIDLAQRVFRVRDAEYQSLDVRDRFPFPKASFDLILANMIFNEITTAGLRRAMRECHRTLSSGGRLLATVPHPDFIESLERRSQLRPLKGGVFTMPGTAGLRLPVVRRSSEEYSVAMEQAGFRFHAEAVYPTAQILRAKPGLRQAGDVPIALLLDCEKTASSSMSTADRKSSKNEAEPTAAPDRGRHPGLARNEGLAGGPGR
jgi:SAM-dependent methyltransferase